MTSTSTFTTPVVTKATPVDIVYLWVNGGDPIWRAKRLRALAKLHPSNASAMAVFGNVEGRFRDNHELRFSLRALERYFPQHGHVYVVTDGQTPYWLRTDDDISQHITIIDHTDLIPASSLPTFDSGHIESYIHRIPNLSERYFYCNDDVFFGAPVQLDHWFWTDEQGEGGIYTGWSDDPEVANTPMVEGATALDNACRLSNAWLVQNFEKHSGALSGDIYQPIYRTFAHAPRPMLKSVLYELETRAPELFEMVRSTIFRVWDKPTIVSDFVLRWSLAHGHAKTRDYAHLHIATGDAALAQELCELEKNIGTLDCFCLNDTLDDAPPSDPRLRKVEDSLAQLLPIASRFEY